MWKIGDRVWGRKGTDGAWCAGVVRHIDGQRSYVIFDDGEDALLDECHLQAFELKVDDGILARQPMETDFRPAKVLAWDDDKIQVRFAGGEENWTSYGMIRRPANTAIAVMASESVLAPGDRVFACWHDLLWYPGIVLNVSGDQYHIVFDNGSQTMTPADRVRAMEFEVGDRVFARFKGGPEYFPGEITSRTGEMVHIQYDDGDEETTSIRMVRLQRDEWFPPSEASNIHEGDRVLGCWFDSNWYPGVVLGVDGKRLHVLFDDGDQALLTADKLRMLDIKEGDRVFCRYKGGPSYFPGTVTRKDGEVIHVNYDDGDEETTSLRLIRLLGDRVLDAERRVD
jgi:hypothetical protein